jgi:hypothetical protein
MSEQNSPYLNAQEVREVREFVDQHSAHPPADADQILDDLDRIILKSESLNTVELTNSLLTQRALESQQREQRSSVPASVQIAIQNDDALADLDSAIASHVRGNAPLAEDGGEAYRIGRMKEIEADQKVAEQQRARAEKAAKQTAARFAGTGFSQERSISADQFYRREGKR